MNKQEINKKRQQTFDSRFGGNPMKNEIIKNKLKKTLLEKYGVDNISKLQKIKDKIAVKNRLSYFELQQKFQQYDLELLTPGNECTGTRTKFKVKCKCGNEFTTSLVKGRPNLCRACFKDRNKDKAYENVKLRLSKFNFIPLFSKEEYEGRYTNKVLKIKCTICNTEQDYVISVSNDFICKMCNPYLSVTHKSALEIEVIEFLKSLNIKIDTVNRSLIKPYELDIYLPDHKMAIEFDGLFWHSEIGGGKDKKYHLTKSELCSEIGIDLIHIFEDEWVEKKEIVKSILKSKLQLNSSLYARKLEIREVIKDEEKEFFNNNHIQGYKPSFYCLGLYDSDILLCAASFSKSRYNKKYEYELLRFSTKLGISVVGGLSRLISHFNKKIITYCDLRYFNGKGYEKAGFLKIKTSPPSYYYMKHYDRRLHREKFQKYKLKSTLNCYNEELTEWGNMKLNGYDRIWDCGNLVFEWKPN